MHSLSFKEYYKLQIQKLSGVSGQDSSVQFYIEGRVGGIDRMISADLMKALSMPTPCSGIKSKHSFEVFRGGRFGTTVRVKEQTLSL